MSLRRYGVVIGVFGLLFVVMVTPASAAAILGIEDVTTAGFDLSTSVTSVLEPGTMALVGVGLFGLASAVRRRIHSKRR
jgi:hypothetical protein